MLVPAPFWQSLIYCKYPQKVFDNVWLIIEMRWHLISRTEHLNTSCITSHGTTSFRVKHTIPGHPIPKISTRLTIFWGGIWKTEFVKTIHRQERTIIRREIRLIPQEMLNRILSNFNVWVAIQQCSAWNEHSINYWKSIVKHYWFYSGFHQKNSINFQ